VGLKVFQVVFWFWLVFWALFVFVGVVSDTVLLGVVSRLRCVFRRDENVEFLH